MIEEKIKQCFNRASSTYDLVADVQKQAAEFLTTKLIALNIDSPNSILDLGSGTGYIPELLLKSFPNANYTLNVISPEMLKFTRNKFKHYNNFTFLLGNMTELDINNYDIIITNFALQWIDNLEYLLKFYKNKSKIFAFSTLLDGSFKQWQDLVNSYDTTNFRKLPNKEFLLDLCMRSRENQDFYHWNITIEKKFDEVSQFLKYVKLLGANANIHNVAPTTIRAIMNKHKNQFSISYEIFFGIFI